MKFSEYTKQKAEETISASYKEVSTDYQANEKFYSGDHYQGGEGWSGALPTTSKDKQATLVKIKALFTSQNVIREVVKRLVDAVISKEPTWNVHLLRPLKEDETPKKNEQETIDEAEQALTEWWNDYNVHKTLREFLRLIALGRKAVLRIYVPSKFSKGGTIKRADFTDQLNKIRVETVEAKKATVYENKDSAESVGIVSFKDDEGNDMIEICYVDENSQTIIKSIRDGVNTASDPVELQGNLLMYQGEGELLITEQIRQLNKMVNKSHTMMNGNLDNGFLERIFLNAQPPGKWEKDENDVEQFVPEPVQVGPGTLNYVAGLETEDEDGNKKMATPSAIFREPVPNTTFIEAKGEAYASILEEVHQKHALIAGDASPSGESRIQALVDFIKSCEDYKSEMDKAGIWLLKTVMYFAWDLAGQGNLSENYGVDFSCRVDPGYLPSEMRKQIIDEYKEGMLSRETAMAMLGVDDIDSEISRIDTATSHVKEVFEVLESANIKPKTMVTELIRKVIEDKEILSDLAKEDKFNEVKTEIESLLDRTVQENDLAGALGL